MPPSRRRDGLAAAGAAGCAVAAATGFWAWYWSDAGPVQVPRLVGGGGELCAAVRARCV